MRTTLTLDADVAAALAIRARERGVSWKATVNGVLRLGLGAEDPPARAPYVTPVWDPGPPRVTGAHGAHDLLSGGLGLPWESLAAFPCLERPLG